MVDKPHQWQTDSSSTTRHSDRIGCFQYGMGSMFQGHKDEVQGEVISPHQLQRDAGSISCITVVLRDVHIKLKVDNTMTMYYMVRIHFPQLMELTTQIWTWCLDRKLFLSPEHANRIRLQIRISRMLGDGSEWKLNPLVFNLLMTQLGPCSVDLFASRLTVQLDLYTS